MKCGREIVRLTYVIMTKSNLCYTGKKTDLNKKDVVKSDGFDLRCRKIFYIKYGDSLSVWQKRMKKLLEKADKEKVKKLALPSIGASK